METEKLENVQSTPLNAGSTKSVVESGPEVFMPSQDSLDRIAEIERQYAEMSQQENTHESIQTRREQSRRITVVE